MAQEVKPIRPHEVTGYKASIIPPQVLLVFNRIIAENWNGTSSRFLQKEVVTALQKEMDIKSHEIFEKNYLDVEPIYREAGWVVDYDKPGYNESYSPAFEFSRKSYT